MRHYIIMLLFISLTSSCGNKVIKIEEEISSLEQTLNTDPSQEVLDRLVESYQKMEKLSSGDQKLDYIWKTGETARSAKQFDVATKSLEHLYQNHPESEYASKALFLHAFMADEDMENIELAGRLYQQFIDKYPTSDFADDAQFLLANLGKTDEEMLEILSRQNTQNDILDE